MVAADNTTKLAGRKKEEEGKKKEEEKRRTMKRKDIIDTAKNGRLGLSTYERSFRQSLCTLLARKSFYTRPRRRSSSKERSSVDSNA